MSTYCYLERINDVNYDTSGLHNITIGYMSLDFLD